VLLSESRLRLNSSWRFLLGLALAALLGTAAAAPAEKRWSRLADIAFQHVTQDQGLPNAIATALAEDGQGFLWVGTLGGLARWDGYRFRVYKADAQQPGALPDNYVQSLLGDARGRLWVGTSSAGLLRHDPATDRFVAYPVGGDQGLSHVSVRQIVDDGAGGLWVVTDAGLDHLDPASGRIEHASGAGGWAEAAGAQVKTLLRDRAGALWLGSATGLFRREPGAAGLIPVALPTAAVVQPEALMQDAAGRVWVGSLHHGVFVLPGRDGAAATAVHELATADGQDLLLNSQIAGLAEVQPGEMWIATLGQGIVSVDFERGETRRIRHVPAWPMSLADNALRALHRDHAGLIWVASNQGLSRYDPQQTAVLTRFGASPDGSDAMDASFNSTEISWIQPMPDGRLWLGTHKSGIDILDASGARVAALKPDPARPETALPQDIVLAMARLPDGSVFIGTKRGLYRTDNEGRRVTRIALAGRDPAASVWALLAEGQRLWVGGQSDGLWQLDLASGRSARVPLAAPGLSDQRVIVLAPGPQRGSLWVGTRHGLNRVDVSTGAVTQLLPGPAASGGLSAGFITALLTDAEQRLWVGSYGGGIDILPAPGKAAGLIRIGVAQGLPDGTVNALLTDLQGQVWASTDVGLARIDPQKFGIRALRRAEGVMFPTYWTGSAARTDRGELLFGGAGGMTVVRPEKLQAWSYRPGVLLTDANVGGRPVPFAPGLAGAAALTVPAHANSLAVEFSSTDFSAPERNRYAFQLEGFDVGWVDSDATRRLAAYTNLPPGDYRLRLRASNRDGQWAERELALPIRVLPAWHQTWWFRIALVIALALLLMAAVAARTRMLRQRQLDLELKVRERTAELQRLHHALEEKSALLEMSSVTDPLTGLHNRRFLAEHIEHDLAAGQRRAQESRAAGGQPLDTDNVFLLLDIDAFKRINDRYGHAAGDTVLVQFGARLRSVLRESDYLVRWGGEEFLAVARDTDRVRAAELAERMRAVIAATPFELDDGTELAVSCSIGFACVPFERERPQARTWQQVVHLADLGLYAAKRSGRNAWVGVHTATGRGAIGARVVGGFGLSSNRELDDVAAAIASPAEPGAVLG
jgi:diguanylate cyclase (GGDEF)-like protein